VETSGPYVWDTHVDSPGQSPGIHPHCFPVHLAEIGTGIPGACVHQVYSVSAETLWFLGLPRRIHNSTGAQDSQRTVSYCVTHTGGAGDVQFLKEGDAIIQADFNGDLPDA
jgi:hypothetical protein